MVEIELVRKNFQVKHKGKEYDFTIKELTGYEKDLLLHKVSKIDLVDGKAKVTIDNPELKKTLFLFSVEKAWVSNVECIPIEIVDKLPKNVYEEVHKAIDKLNNVDEAF